MSLPTAPPPPPRIDTYELTDPGPGYRFFGICQPTDSVRSITAFADSKKQVEDHIKSLL